MTHKFIMELEDTCKGYEAELGRLEMLYGVEPIEEHDKQIYNKGYNDGVARHKLNCDDCFYKLSLEEHDKQIREKAIDDCIKALDCMQTPPVLGITYDDGIADSMIRLEQLKGE